MGEAFVEVWRGSLVESRHRVSIALCDGSGLLRGWTGNPELGIALKVEDGAQRAAEPMLIAVLRALSLLADDELARLDPFVEPILRNTRGEEVGFIRATLKLEGRRG